MDDIPKKSPAASRYLPQSNAQIVESEQGLILTVSKGHQTSLWVIAVVGLGLAGLFYAGIEQEAGGIGAWLSLAATELLLLGCFIYAYFLFKTSHWLLITDEEIIHRRRKPWGKEERTQIALSDIAKAEFSHQYSYRHRAEIRLYSSQKAEILLFGRSDTHGDLANLLNSVLLQQIYQRLLKNGVANAQNSNLKP